MCAGGEEIRAYLQLGAHAQVAFLHCLQGIEVEPELRLAYEYEIGAVALLVTLRAKLPRAVLHPEIREAVEAQHALAENLEQWNIRNPLNSYKSVKDLLWL